MRSISTKKMSEIKKKGGTLKIDRSAIKEKPKSTDSVEKSLTQLNQYVKQIVTKKDTTELLIKSASGIVGALSDIASKMDASARRKAVKNWDVSVSRDGDKLIKSLKMTAAG